MNAEVEDKAYLHAGLIFCCFIVSFLSHFLPPKISLEEVILGIIFVLCVFRPHGISFLFSIPF